MSPAALVADVDTDLVNVAGLRALLERHELGALVCRGGINVAYLSGISTPGTLGRHLDLTETPREMFVVWPAEGEPVVVVSEIAGGLARTTSRIAELRTYRDYVDSPEAALAVVLAGLRLDRARIGFDLAWFSARRWSDLRRRLPAVVPVDCTDQVAAVLAIKTAAEVERLRRAARVLDRAFIETFDGVVPDQTEREVHAALTAHAIELGGSGVHGILQSSTNPVLYGGESEVRLRKGDLVRTDYVAYVDGYAANLSRILHIGRPNDDVLRRYASYLDVYHSAVDLLRAGATGGAIHVAIGDLFEQAGWERGPAISGHGIGVWFHQQHPMLVPGSPDLLQPGMVVAIEPISGHWHVQDEYLITDGEPVRISDGFDITELPWAG
jgi:Xaa-Pro aminopeptidase